MIDLASVLLARNTQPKYHGLEQLTLDITAYLLCKKSELESKINAMQINCTVLIAAFVFKIEDKIVMSLDAYNTITPLIFFMS